MDEGSKLLRRIQEAYESLPKKQRKIAEFVTANIQEVIFYSISELAATLGVSEAAVVRFAQYFGYSGYPELKKVLIQHYKDHLNPANRIKSYLGEIQGQDFIYPGMVQKECEYLQRSIAEVDKKSFTEAVHHLSTADTIYIFGSGPNQCLADYLGFRLNRFRRPTVQVSETGRHLFERFILIRPADFVVTYAFYKASSDVSHLLEFLKERDIPNLLITDTRVPPMLRYARLVLAARRGPFGVFHSPLVPMAISNALIIGVAEKLGDKAMESLRELSDIRKRYYQDEISDLAAGGKGG